MASDKEINSTYKNGYYFMLGELKRVKLENPDAYDEMAKVANNYRAYVLDVAELDHLPEVPPK